MSDTIVETIAVSDDAKRLVKTFARVIQAKIDSGWTLVNANADTTAGREAVLLEFREPPVLKNEET